MATRKSPTVKRTYRPRAPKPAAECGIVTLILNRQTGLVEIDQTFSNPLEAQAMCQRASEMLVERAPWFAEPEPE